MLWPAFIVLLGIVFTVKARVFTVSCLAPQDLACGRSPPTPHHPTSSPRHSAPATLSSLCPPIKPGIHPPQGLSTCQSHIYPQLFPPLSLSHVALKCLICLLNKAFLDCPILKDSSFSPLTHILLPCLIFLCQLIALWHAVMFYFCSCLSFFSRLSSVKALIFFVSLIQSCIPVNSALIYLYSASDIVGAQ